MEVKLWAVRPHHVGADAEDTQEPEAEDEHDDDSDDRLDRRSHRNVCLHHPQNHADDNENDKNLDQVHGAVPFSMLGSDRATGACYKVTYEKVMVNCPATA